MSVIYNLIYPLFGDLSYYILLMLTSTLRNIFCTLLFSIGLKRRKFFIPRIFLCVLFFITVMTGIAFIRSRADTAFTRILARQLDHFISLTILFLLFKETAPVILIQWCAGIATSDLSGRIFDLLIVISGNNPSETISIFSNGNEMIDMIVLFAVHAVVIIIFWLIFSKTDLFLHDQKISKKISVLSFITVLSLGILSGFTREYMNESVSLYTIDLVYAILLSSFILLIRRGILTEGSYLGEIDILEELLREEKKQYESSKGNIDLINMKMHDLKHRLSSIDSKLTEDEISSLKEAITVYDNSINTGNEALNVLLYEKQLVCESCNIHLTCMANGRLLEFMRAPHLYSLFNNAIENAIEAVQKLNDPEKRWIDVTVRKQGQAAIINVSNYYDTDKDDQEILFTTKSDSSHHGYGLKSMRYITDLYNGLLRVNTDNGIFHLEISIPLPRKT